MFNSQLQRLQNIPLNSLEDVRAMMREFVLLVGAEQSIEHFGKLNIKHRSSLASSPEGNSALIVDHWNDGTSRSPGEDLSEDEAHGIWVRHGTAKFEDPVFFGTPPSVMFRGTSTAKWATGSPPTVAVTELDEGLGAVSVRLASTTTQDPNIRSGETITFGKATDGLYYAFDSHLDGKIGDVKMWVGTAANIPPGWRLLDSGGSYNTSGRVPQGTQTIGYAIGTTGGGATHTHTFTSDAGGDHSHGGVTSSTAPATDSQGAHTHTSPTTGAGGDHSHTGVTGGATLTTDSSLGAINTDYATASVTTTNTATGLLVGAHTPNTTTAGAGATVVLDNTSSWSHAITDSGHVHVMVEPNSGTGHRHAIATLAHTHTVSSHTHSISASGTHTHAGGTTSSDGAHTHTVAGHTHVIATSGTHTHTGTTATGSSYDPFITVAFIERFE